ncbi:DUF2290 domain-containing protein [Bacillus wiedmannii]|uniref:DUF2290 domain-containing protein n=1 Tax=Bacillus wiedmannii TaxID=1890302 RepID=UPI0007DB601A|nr:DUF2290 domain-containing protein [Bacillus wiedmannii]OAK17196.1 hypothetical protein A6281_08615 [Bacillus wiedmannii]PEO97605.1 DUF2290 domain-containing protein [Bacillus wiedmannii]
MNIAGILDSLKDVKKILKESELYKETNQTRKMSLNIGKYSEQFIKLSQKKDYEKLYKVAMENMDYDFLLKDDSFFQFSCVLSNNKLEEGTIRYAYYENPRSYNTYEQFLEGNGFEYSECGEELRLEYEQEIAEARLKNSVTPIRYDYDFKLYEPIHHPISHIHIGHNNDVRIPLSKILTPAKFVNFVLRNAYSKQWKVAFQNESFQDLCISTKNSCYDVQDTFFQKKEKDFLYMI